jgi:hypothetical protein
MCYTAHTISSTVYYVSCDDITLFGPLDDLYLLNSAVSLESQALYYELLLNNLYIYTN